VHLVVGIIGIAAALVLDKGETAHGQWTCWYGWVLREVLTVCWKRFGERECRSGQDVHNCQRSAQDPVHTAYSMRMAAQREHVGQWDAYRSNS
jgi:hypothetical protein